MLYPITVECTLFTHAHKTFKKIDYILSIKQVKFEKTEDLQSVFSDDKGIQLGISNNKDTWKISQHTSNEHMIKEEMMRKV